MISVMADGSIEFRLFARGAGRVELLGSFTGWEREAIEMQTVGDGWFVAKLSIPHGDHEFQYRIDGTTWLADYGASGVRMNEFGLWVSQLVVAEPRPRRMVVQTRPVRPQVTPAPGGRVRLTAA